MLFIDPTKDLDTISSRDAFERHVAEHAPAGFLEMRSQQLRAIEQNRVLLDHLKINLHGARCLDIGPGHGDSLDLWHELGASECAFVDRDPWSATHNRLKPYRPRGWQMQHFLSIQQLPERHFDFVWSYGAMSARQWYCRAFRGFGLRHWLRRVERLCRPNATIVICPHWSARDGVRLDGDPEYHWIAESFERAGFKPLPFLSGHNIEPVYPITWIKEVPRVRERTAARRVLDFAAIRKLLERISKWPAGAVAAHCLDSAMELIELADFCGFVA